MVSCHRASAGTKVDFHRATLNVCFPYTSRDEITTAVRNTVIAYSKPHPPPFKRPFSETHITRNIRAQLLSTVPEDVPSQRSDSRSVSPSSSKSSKDLNASDVEHSSAASTLMNQSEKSDTSPPLTYPDPENITAATLTSNMFTHDAPPLDLLVRTSGVERLSDFMLWQCHQNTSIVFLDCLWPEFDLWHFLPVLVEWQWQRKKLEERERGRVRYKMD